MFNYFGLTARRHILSYFHRKQRYKVARGVSNKSNCNKCERETKFDPPCHDVYNNQYVLEGVQVILS